MPTSKVPGNRPVRGRTAPRTEGRRFLTDEDVRTISVIVRNWPALPMTWQDVCDRVARDVQKISAPGRTGRGYGSDAKGWTRQALARHDSIKDAYDRRSKELVAEKGRVAANPSRNRDQAIVMLRRERDSLRIENEGLRAKLAVYEERFSTLVYNKELGATTEEEMLRSPSPKIDRRGRT